MTCLRKKFLPQLAVLAVSISVVACGGSAGSSGSTAPVGTATDVTDVVDNTATPVTDTLPIPIDETVTEPVVEMAVEAIPETNTEPAVDNVELAIETGDAMHVSNSQPLEDALIREIANAKLINADAYAKIFSLQQDGSPRSDGSSLTNIRWNPTHDAARLYSTFGENSDLLTSNSVFETGYTIKNEALAVIGEADARYIVMGSNPMRNYRRDSSSVNEEMQLMMENSISWLTDRTDLHSTPFNAVIAQMSQSYYFPDELAVREWLDDRFSQQAVYNDQDTCEGASLSSCINKDTDILIISNHQNELGHESKIAEAVTAAMSQGVPVLYMHYDGGMNELSTALLPLFDTSYRGDNYWQKLSVEAYDPTDFNQQLSAEVTSVDAMAKHFRSNGFAINWAECDGENCNAVESLNTQFLDGAKYVRSLMQQLDKEKNNLFATPDKYRFQKLLALLGDHYRASANFPLDKVTTPTSEFLRALYADYSVYQYRPIVGVWGNMGNFSRTDFSHINPTSRTISQLSKRKFRSTGAYALPGQTVTATRSDNSDVNVSVFVNTLRSGSTHVFAESGYKRPQFTQGTAIALEPGETITFTSPSGGPIQLSYNVNDLPVQVTFNNIGEHPYWRSADDNEIFESKMVAAEYDWAEIAAPSFEVHSKHDKMLDSMANEMFGPNGGTAQQLVDAIMRYVHNFPHVLAGFQGPGIDVVDEIHSFASDNGLEVYNLDLVKHMNADQATCGYGCSGNPYDAYWSFSPIGHGDIHELGHGLERGRFRFTGWEGHSITNPYSYYTKSQYFKDTGNDPNCQALPFEASFNILNDSFAQADPQAYVKENLWTNPSWSDSAAMTIQMMMSAEDNGALIDGWHLLARMHIIEREYQQAIKDDATWLQKRAGLGMSQYDRATAKAMSPEDWLLIVVSHATGFDFREYFDVWAHVYSDAAAEQVIAMALPEMPVNYYVSSAKGYCKGEGFDGVKIPLDGAQRYWLQ